MTDRPEEGLLYVWPTLCYESTVYAENSNKQNRPPVNLETLTGMVSLVASNVGINNSWYDS